MTVELRSLMLVISFSACSGFDQSFTDCGGRACKLDLHANMENLHFPVQVPLNRKKSAVFGNIFAEVFKANAI